MILTHENENDINWLKLGEKLKHMYTSFFQYQMTQTCVRSYNTLTILLQKKPKTAFLKNLAYFHGEFKNYLGI